MLEVWQAEWCPHSRVVRERLTELMVDFVAHQVEPDREDRERLRAATGADGIPALVFDDGSVVTGSDEELLAALDHRFREPPQAEGHRRKDATH